MIRKRFRDKNNVMLGYTLCEVYRKQKKILLYKVLHIFINIWAFELTYIANSGLCSSIYARHRTLSS